MTGAAARSGNAVISRVERPHRRGVVCPTTDYRPAPLPDVRQNPSPRPLTWPGWLQNLSHDSPLDQPSLSNPPSFFRFIGASPVDQGLSNGRAIIACFFFEATRKKRRSVTRTERLSWRCPISCLVSRAKGVRPIFCSQLPHCLSQNGSPPRT